MRQYREQFTQLFKLFLISATILMPFCSQAASDGVTVTSPTSGENVSTSFALQATSITCQGQPVAALAYSFNNGGDSPPIYARTINNEVSTSPGQNQILHVKSWGNQGSSCHTDVTINVTSSIAGVSVSNPTSGETVNSTFQLQAVSNTCNGQPVSAMAYSFGNGANSLPVYSTSLNTQVNTSAEGNQILHVKSWGNQGTSCHTDVNLNIVGGISISATNSTNIPLQNYSHISGMGNDSNGLTFDLGYVVSGGYVTYPIAVAQAGNYTVTLTYSSPSGKTGANVIIGGTTAGAASFSPSGSWGSYSQAPAIEVALSVGTVTFEVQAQNSGFNLGGISIAPAAGPSIPSTATKNIMIENTAAWNCTNNASTSGGGPSPCNQDPGTPGMALGSSSMVSSPTMNGKPSRIFTNQYSNWGGEIFHNQFDNDPNSKNFVYENWIWISSQNTGTLGNLEMDLNQVIPNGNTVIYGFQCDGDNGTWDYTMNNGGNPSKPDDVWVHSVAYCSPNTWPTNTWNHIQIQFSRDQYGNVNYGAVWLNGVPTYLNVTVPSAFALGWGAGQLLTNLQIDGGDSSSGNLSVYTNTMNVYRW